MSTSSFQRNDSRSVRPYQGIHTAEFSELLQRLSGERKQIAADLGIPYGTYDNYVRGLQSFPPDLLARLFAVTGEVRIIEFILDPLGLMAVHKPDLAGGKDCPDIFRMLLEIAERLGLATHEIRTARADGRVTADEKPRAKYFLREIQRIARETEHLFDAEGER